MFLSFIVCVSVLTLLHYYKTSVGKRGFEPIFSTSYLTPMYQIGWILANLYYSSTSIFCYRTWTRTKTNRIKIYCADQLHHPTIWAGDWVRTSNFVLGRNALYQLSYTRFCAFWELRYPDPIINSDVLYLWAKKAYKQKNP